MVHSQQHKPILCKLLAGFHTGGRGGRGAEFLPLRSLKTYFALKQGTMAPDQLVLQHLHTVLVALIHVTMLWFGHKLGVVG